MNRIMPETRPSGSWRKHAASAVFTRRKTPDPVVFSSTDQDGASPSKDGAAAMRSVPSVIAEEGDSEVKVLPSAVEAIFIVLEKCF